MSPELRVAVAAPRGRPCGIGDYASFLVEALGPELDCHWLDLPTDSFPRAWKQAAARADGFQVVHVHFEPSLFHIPRPYANRFATFMNRLQPPALVTLHDGIPPLRPRWGRPKPYGFGDLVRDLTAMPFYGSWEKRQYRRARHWLVHAPELAARAGLLAGPERVSQVLHPIPPVGHLWSSREDHPLDLISPGFIKAHKGYQDLAELLVEGPSLTWDLAGGPQDEYDRDFTARLQDRIGHLGLEGRVRLTGYLERNDLETMAIRAKAAIFPFRWAAGSGSLTWAIGLGLPILATDLPALAQFQEAGAGIRLLPRHDRSQWPERIASVLRDPGEQARLSRANRDFAESHNYSAFARRVEVLYRLTAG